MWSVEYRVGERETECNREREGKESGEWREERRGERDKCGMMRMRRMVWLTRPLPMPRSLHSIRDAVGPRLYVSLSLSFLGYVWIAHLRRVIIVWIWQCLAAALSVLLLSTFKYSKISFNYNKILFNYDKILF